MKACSLDFRQKIVDVYKQEELSQRQLAKRFGVAKSFTIRGETGKAAFWDNLVILFYLLPLG